MAAGSCFGEGQGEHQVKSKSKVEVERATREPSAVCRVQTSFFASTNTTLDVWVGLCSPACAYLVPAIASSLRSTCIFYVSCIVSWAVSGDVVGMPPPPPRLARETEPLSQRRSLALWNGLAQRTSSGHGRATTTPVRSCHSSTTPRHKLKRATFFSLVDRAGLKIVPIRSFNSAG